MEIYQPFPFRNDCGQKIIREPYQEDFIDKSDNRATITKIDYTYKTNKGKGKLITVIGHILYVKWYYTNEYWKK